jgi:hypothetical protein
LLPASFEIAKTVGTGTLTLAPWMATHEVINRYLAWSRNTTMHILTVPC